MYSGTLFRTHAATGRSANALRSDNDGRMKHLDSMKHAKSLASTLVLLNCFIATGCSPDVELGVVGGTITQNGKPVDSILVHFMPDPTSGTPGAMSTGISDENGQYQLTYEGEGRPKGAVTGKHRVVVNDLAPENFRGKGRPPESRVRPGWMSAGATPFRFIVKPGEQEIDISLEP